MNLTGITNYIHYGVLDDFHNIKYHDLKSLGLTPADIINTKIEGQELKDYVKGLLLNSGVVNSLSTSFALEFIDLCDFDSIAIDKTEDLKCVAYSDYDSLN